MYGRVPEPALNACGAGYVRGCFVPGTLAPDRTSGIMVLGLPAGVLFYSNHFNIE